MMDKIQTNINNSYLLGCVKYRNRFTFYLMPIAYWILNHYKYNPNYKPEEWEFVFRDNILNVEDNNIELFIQSIEVDKIDVDSKIVIKYNLRNIFFFFVDFDSHTFVSYFDDISVEDYLPSDKWKGIFDNPINYLPFNLKVFFLTDASL